MNVIFFSLFLLVLKYKEQLTVIARSRELLHRDGHEKKVEACRQTLNNITGSGAREGANVTHMRSTGWEWMGP